MNFWQKFLFVFLCVVILYSLGPAPSKPKLNPVLPVVPQEAAALEKYIAQKEHRHKIKPDNEARIVWINDSAKNRTRYSIVYLHGFSASQEEGDPVHRDIAKRFGCNLYLSRLAEHGIDTTDAMLNFSADKLWETAKEALAIGHALGDTVILIGTSTGGTLNLLLAIQYPDIKALINLSPNIMLNNPTAWILNNPWGLQVARMVMHGNDFVAEGESGVYKQYWCTRYRLEALTELEELLESQMKASNFEKVKTPVLNLYYFKNEQEQDKVVEVSAILDMHEALGTPANLKSAVAMPNAGNHVLGSALKSKDIEGVKAEIEKFMIEKLKINKL